MLAQRGLARQDAGGSVQRGRTDGRPDRTFATPEHYVSTLSHDLASINEPHRRGVVEDLEANAKAAGLTLFGLKDRRQGIVHVVGPEQGLSAVDLEGQTTTGPDGVVDRFEIDPFRKDCLLAGTDDISFTLGQSDRIAAFENAYEAKVRWL